MFIGKASCFGLLFLFIYVCYIFAFWEVFDAMFPCGGDCYIDTDSSNVYYLGYNLNLSGNEFKIFCSIAYNSPEYISAEKILRECFPNKYKTPGNVAVHVCNINRKARVIGGRGLIISKYKSGYRLNIEN